MRVVVAVLLVTGWAGCGFKPTDGHTTGDGGLGDAPDAAIRKDGCSTFSTLFDTCTMAAGGSDVTLPGPADYDTGTNTLTVGATAPMHPKHVLVPTPEGMIDVLIANTFTLTGKLRVHGTNAFGIAAENGITLDGQIDLTDAGAAARTDAQCAELVGLSGKNMSSHGGGGGGGGYFGGGGVGMNSTTTNATGGAGGFTSGMPSDGLLGGCDGGKGGESGGGQAGDGGGAILLATAASLSLTANGVVNVGGGGGHGGNNNSGGGGGGSGGMIVIEASVLANLGAIAANGGGGGEGGDNGAGMRGQTGQASSARALGGFGTTNSGGAGALGGAALTPGGADDNLVQANGGGGGGGGGAGYIAIARATANGVISPPAIPWP